MLRLTILFLTASILLVNSIIEDKERQCRERIRLIGAEEHDLFKVVNAHFGQDFILECHYCNENDDMAPKIWYRKRSPADTNALEVVLDVNDNVSLNRVYVSPQHELIIKNFQNDDAGLYYCHGKYGQDEKMKYNYLLDPVLNMSMKPVIGNLTDWAKYDEKYVLPVNEKLSNSDRKELKSVRVTSEWQAWGPCVVCQRPRGERRRLGRCQLMQTTPDNQESSVDHFLFSLSCRSVHLSRVLPDLSSIVSVVPDFIQVEHCMGSCSHVGFTAQKLRVTSAPGKEVTEKKLMSRYVLTEGEALNLVCPRAMVDSVITWKLDKKVLDPEEVNEENEQLETPWRTIDPFGTLHLFDVGYDDEGEYQCFVDDVKTLDVTLSVTRRSLLVSEAFVRHLAYLGYFSLIGLIIFCVHVYVQKKLRWSKWSRPQIHDP